MQLLLARFDRNQSVGKLAFYHFKLNTTDKKRVTSVREKNPKRPAAVLVSKTSLPKLYMYILLRSALTARIVPSKCLRRSREI